MPGRYFPNVEGIIVVCTRAPARSLRVQLEYEIIILSSIMWDVLLPGTRTSQGDILFLCVDCDMRYFCLDKYYCDPSVSFYSGVMFARYCIQNCYQFLSPTHFLFLSMVWHIMIVIFFP